ncbi:MAG TPA: BON domain-containing protein [Terriglobia bacterium]
MNRSLHLIMICVLGAGLSLYAHPLQQNTPPDNTQINKQDRNTNNPTADRQSGNRSDVEITRQIRRSLTGDKTLSSYAKNVKIVTQGGNVTLRGPVRSEEEKKSIEAKANDVAGAGHVKSELQIAAKEKAKNNP